MGDTSVMARRLADGHVQYGWSGNGGYFRVVGLRLLVWYKAPEDVEYLFRLGQTSFIGKKGSEKGGFGWMETHSLTGEPCWLDQTERMIFSKMAFADYGYFYDTDQKWYYIIPGPFRIKMPLELVYNNLDEDDFEFDFLEEIQDTVLTYIRKRQTMRLTLNETPLFYERRGFLHSSGSSDDQGIRSSNSAGSIFPCLSQRFGSSVRIYLK